MFEFERIEFSSCFWLVLRNVAEDDIKQIVTDVYGAFHAWKLKQADANGLVATIPILGRGLLGWPFDPSKIVMAPVDDVEAWECAGRDVYNDIDLSLKLAFSDDPDIRPVVEAHGYDKVLAVVGIWSAKTADPRSLARLLALLYRLQAGSLLHHQTVSRELFDELKAAKSEPNASVIAKKLRSLRSAGAKGWARERHHQLLGDEYDTYKTGDAVAKGRRLYNEWGKQPGAHRATDGKIVPDPASFRRYVDEFENSD